MGTFFDFIIRTSVVLLVFLVPLAWSPWTFEAFEFSKQYLLFFLVLLGLFAWIARMVLVEREVRFKKTPLTFFVFLFVAAALLSSLFSADRWSSLFGHYGSFSDGLPGILASAGVYFLVTNAVRQPRFLLKPFFASAALAVFLAYLSLFGVLPQAGFNPVAENFESFSVFLAFLISLLSFFVIRPQQNQLPFAGTIVLLVSAFGLLLAAHESTNWAVVFAGLLLSLFAGLLQRLWTGEAGKIRGLGLPLLLLFLTFVALLSPAWPDLPWAFPLEPALSQRMSWGIALDTVSDNAKNLFLGSGPGTFALDVSLHKPVSLNQTDQWQTRFDRPSSFFAGLFATTGLLGFLLYLALLCWFFLVSLAFLRKQESMPFLLGAAVLAAGQVAHDQMTALQLSFWLFLGLCQVSWKIPARETRFSLPRTAEFQLAARAALLLVFLASAAAFFFGSRLYAADMKYAASVKAAPYFPAAGIEQGQEAAGLNPWQAEYRIFLSRLHLQRALAELQKPENLRSKEQVSKDVQLAIAYARGGSVEDQRIVGALELSSARVASWETLGTVYKNIASAPGALDWGIRSFETAIALEPANPVLHTELGKLYVKNEQFDKARERFQKAIELKPDYAQARMQLALIAEKEGNAGKAIGQLHDLVVRFPRDSETLFQLGRLYYNEGEVAGAISQFERVLAGAPNHSNALFALGLAYESQGRIQEAAQKFERVLQLNPGNEEVRRKLQELGRESIIRE
ncbi:MAG: hypothetical protein A2672_00055 [Candidatus Wildermuthbacteria bacterium RIFCSPHIGHO2_01_FULL_49_22b]|uniref:Uncharacterized protein n=1 Tax=Candidatus Wildermuthbacteria bacterium RIFCSPHIGHO2_01_FULL_49_22b TaxID=1802448 RepID=A0A1G2R131_9BACT|nr:MAG: hypothetical protein A2672_00055 [Candidatus Wildermuthbacteria bacterium RIFCSPHIGHO2_01_FULL_49_22b]